MNMVRTTGILLACCAFSSLATGCASSKGKPNELKVLMIGNSFSISCLDHLPKVALSCGVDLDLASLYIGGCSMERHWENIQKAETDSGFRPYRFDLYRNGGETVKKGARNIQEALKSEAWDVVTIQQASRESFRKETFSPYGDKIVETIRRYAPNAKIVVQETWSYTPWDKRLAKWKIDQNEMYEKLHAAYGEFAAQRGFELIPMGTAVQEWRRRLPVRYTENSFGGDVVGGGSQAPRDQFKRDAKNTWVPNCDVCHLNPKGNYLQALVWAASLFKGVDVSACTYKPADVTDGDAKLMRKIAVELAK